MELKNEMFETFNTDLSAKIDALRCKEIIEADSFRLYEKLEELSEKVDKSIKDQTKTQEDVSKGISNDLNYEIEKTR